MVCEIVSLPPATMQLLGRIRATLEARGVLSVSTLARQMGVTPTVARKGLDYWVRRGQAEALYPCRQPHTPHDHLDFYRWKSPQDGDCLWEQRIGQPDATTSGRRPLLITETEWEDGWARWRGAAP